MNCFSLVPRVGVTALTALLGLSLLPNGASAQFPGQGPNPFLPPAATLHAPRIRNYHVRHLKLIFAVNAKEHSAHGVVTHYLTPLRTALPAVTLDARASLKIEVCKIDGKDVPFQHEQGHLTLIPTAPLPLGKEAVVEITYAMPTQAVGGGANGAGGFRWIDPDPDVPERRVGFWTQGETATNSTWVPCYDAPNDKCTSETHVTVPEAWIVIGNGLETPATHNATAHTRTYHWTMKQPHSTYLLSLVGGEIDLQKSIWKGVPLYYAVPKGKGNLIPGSFGNTPDMLSWFSDNLGVKYPWPKYAQCAVFDFPGGMENVSATTLGSRRNLDILTDMRSGHFTMSSLTSHELGHQWFGDLVTCKDWGDVWLNEGFATFMEMFYMEHLDGKEQYERELEGKLGNYLQSAQIFKRPLSISMYSNPDALFGQGHTYSKGALVLHTLRRELGDKLFFRSLRRYLEAYKYQNVETADLEKAVSAETHRDFKPFFDQWVRKPGHPVLDMTWTYDETRHEVVATVKQLQDTSDGTPIYTTPLTFGLVHAQTNANIPSLRQVSFPAERAQTGNEGLQRQRVLLDQATQEFHLPAPEKPAVLLLDPDHDLLKEVKDTHWTDADMPALLRFAPDSVDRRYAAGRLVSSGGMDAVRTALFTQALKTETSGSVAAFLIDRLAPLKSEELRPLFRVNAQSKHIARRVAALNALSQFPLTAEDTKLLRAAALSDTEPYSVVATALRGLGGPNAAANIDVFTHQITQASPNDQLAAACVTALAQADQEAAVPALLLGTKPERWINTCLQAIRALGTLAPNSPAVHTTLLGLLNDDETSVQQAAIRALVTRKDKDAIPALQALADKTKSPTVQSAAKDAVEEIGK